MIAFDFNFLSRRYVYLVEKENDCDLLENSVVDDRVEDCPELNYITKFI